MISQDDRQAHLGPADFVLYDTRSPYWARTVGADGRPIQALTFLFPRSLLPLPPGQLNRLTATRMAAGRGVGALTSEFLVQLARNLEHYRPAEATRLATAALQVLAIRLAHELDGDGWIAPHTHQQALLTRIYAFIQQHLGDPELSPGAVAAAHHISVSYLQKLFHAEGATVAGWGFLHPGHFSRAFKAAYGVRPLDYRWSSRLAANGVDGS